MFNATDWSSSCTKTRYFANVHVAFKITSFDDDAIRPNATPVTPDTAMTSQYGSVYNCLPKVAPILDLQN